jgi:hypothetical protein
MINGIDHAGESALAGRMADLVMIFGVDHTRKHVAAQRLFDRGFHRTKVALRIVDLRG